MRLKKIAFEVELLFDHHSVQVLYQILVVLLRYLVDLALKIFLKLPNEFRVHLLQLVKFNLRAILAFHFIYQIQSHERELHQR